MSLFQSIGTCQFIYHFNFLCLNYVLITFTCHYIHVMSELISAKYIFDIFTGVFSGNLNPGSCKTRDLS